MTTQVDWNWQISNRPNLGNVLLANSSSTVTYGANTVTFDNSAGIGTDSTGFVTLNLASVTQTGNIGTSGGQQMAGPFILATIGSPYGPPSFPLTSWNLIMQDRGIAFYDETDGAITFPNSYIKWNGMPPTYSGMEVWSEGDLFLAGGGAGGVCKLENPLQVSYVQLSTGAPYLVIHDPTNVVQQGNNSSTVLGTQPFRATRSFDISDTTGHPYMCYTLYGGQFVGQWGTLPDGSAISGGLVTTIGTGGGSSSVTMSGDVTGASSSNTLVKIQGNAVSASSPGVGDFLQWNGSDWIPNHGTVSNSDGTLTISPTTGAVVASLNLGHSNTWTVPQTIAPGTTGVTALTITNHGNADPFLTLNDSTTSPCFQILDNSGVPYMYFPKNPGAISCDGFFQIACRGGPVCLYVDTDGGFGIEATQNFKANVQTQLCFLSGGFGVFAASPVTQQTAGGVTAGFTPHTSANAVFNESTWTGNIGSTAYTISDIVAAFKLYGWLAQ